MSNGNNTADVASAITILANLLTTITNSVASATQVSSIIQGAQTQGRSTLTDSEWAIVTATQTQSRQDLADAIAKVLAGA